MDQVRFGVIGAGQISYSACESIAKHADAGVVANFDPDAGRRDLLADKFGVKSRYDSAEALLADENVDAVYVAVPNKFHAPLAKQALEAGKNVILDKPFALNLAEAKGVVAAAQKSGKTFTLGMNQRFGRDQQKVKALVEGGKLGEVYHVKSFWFRRSGIPKMGTWFGNKELSGGGCLLDIGVHLLDLALYLTDNFEPVSVFGQTYTKFGNRGLGEGGWGMSDKQDLKFDVDDFATALIKFKNGLSVNLDVSWACHAEDANRSDVVLYGTDAGAGAYSNKLYHADYDTGEYVVTQNAAAEIRYPHCDRFHNFINALLGREELCCTADQALAVQAILDGIYESSKTGKPVDLKLET